MRLLHTQSLQLHTFYDDDIPPYAILSHTWGRPEEEVSLQELGDPSVKSRPGFRKIERCCTLAASEGWSFVWIDTCCIDKTSSAELSEAINSMYAWYEKAQVCYVYLADVSREPSTDLISLPYLFPLNSRWFERGWTLQELLAPYNVVFYDRDWRPLGSKWSLCAEVSKATGISIEHLKQPRDACIAVKLSWASRRKTTRIEDIAYCLFGLLDVNLPLIYGEGPKAFLRLQYEVVRTSSDESIFAWTDPDMERGGIFARSPSVFALSGDIVVPSLRYLDRIPYIITNRGLAMQVCCEEHNEDHFSDSLRCESNVELQCHRAAEEESPIRIRLIRRSRNEWCRAGKWNDSLYDNHAPYGHDAPYGRLSETRPQKVIYIDTVNKPFPSSIPRSLNGPTPRFETIFIINRNFGFHSEKSLSLVHSYVSDGELIVMNESIRISYHHPKFLWFHCLLELRYYTSETRILSLRAHENDETISTRMSLGGEWDKIVEDARLRHRRTCCFVEDFADGWSTPSKHSFSLSRRKTLEGVRECEIKLG